jgi:hypothetical protein
LNPYPHSAHVPPRRSHFPWSTRARPIPHSALRTPHSVIPKPPPF